MPTVLELRQGLDLLNLRLKDHFNDNDDISQPTIYLTCQDQDEFIRLSDRLFSNEAEVVITHSEITITESFYGLRVRLFSFRSLIETTQLIKYSLKLSREMKAALALKKIKVEGNVDITEELACNENDSKEVE